MKYEFIMPLHRLRCNQVVSSDFQRNARYQSIQKLDKLRALSPSYAFEQFFVESTMFNAIEVGAWHLAMFFWFILAWFILDNIFRLFCQREVNGTGGLLVNLPRILLKWKVLAV